MPTTLEDMQRQYAQLRAQNSQMQAQLSSLSNTMRQQQQQKQVQTHVVTAPASADKVGDKYSKQVLQSVMKSWDAYEEGPWTKVRAILKGFVRAEGFDRAIAFHRNPSALRSTAARQEHNEFLNSEANVEIFRILIFFLIEKVNNIN
jgi:hypothetical protein